MTAKLTSILFESNEGDRFHLSMTAVAESETFNDMLMIVTVKQGEVVPIANFATSLMKTVFEFLEKFKYCKIYSNQLHEPNSSEVIFLKKLSAGERYDFAKAADYLNSPIMKHAWHSYFVHMFRTLTVEQMREMGKQKYPSAFGFKTSETPPDCSKNEKAAKMHDEQLEKLNNFFNSLTDVVPPEWTYEFPDLMFYE